MKKNKILAGLAVLALGLVATQTQAFTDVKGGSVTIQESAGGGGDSGNLNDLIKWLENPDVAISTNLQGGEKLFFMRGEFQNKLLRKLLENLGGTEKYPNIIDFIDKKISTKDWTWSYINYANIQSGDAKDCPKESLSAPTSDNGSACMLSLLGALELTSPDKPAMLEELQELRTWLDDNQPELGKFLGSPWISGNLNTPEKNNQTFQIFNTSCDLTCNQENKYTYTFKYLTDKQGGWNPCSDGTFDGSTKTYAAQKCEDIKVAFAPEAEWFSMLDGQCGAGKKFVLRFASPPTPFTVCADKTSCLAGAEEFDMSDGSKARGVQQVPENFVINTEKSLVSSNNTRVPCTNGVCTPNTSGDYTLSASTPSSTYFGQCSGSGVTIAPPEAPIPAISSTFNIRVANRAPVPTVTVSKNPIDTNEEITATCDIVDPDECTDKIAKIKWSCTDSQGKSGNCAFFRQGTNAWLSGEMVNDIPTTEKDNPFRATVKFRASQIENYAVTCEATDDDAVNPLTGEAVAGVTVKDNCGADGVCNQSCPYDPDCCVDPYCLPYCPGYGFPHCVVPAGSCVVARTKPSMDIDAVKPLDEVRFQAAVNGGSNPLGYTWYCDRNSNASVSHTNTARTDNQTCTYQNEGIYEPKASYQYKDEKGNIKSGECVSAQGVGIEVSNGVKNASSCSVATDNTNIGKGNTITAKLSASPGDVRLGSLSVTWKADGKTSTQSADKAFQTRLNTAGANKIEAVVKNPDGTSVTCGPATVDVAESVRWR